MILDIMKKAFSTFFWLLLFWVILSGQVVVLYLLSGIVCAFLALRLIRKLSISNGNNAGFSLKSLLYFAWLAKEIAVSALKVSIKIWTPQLKLAHDMRYIGTKIKTRAGRVLYASSITLTPGTITIDLKNDSLLVHALDKEDLKDLERGKMEGRIKEI